MGKKKKLQRGQKKPTINMNAPIESADGNETASASASPVVVVKDSVVIMCSHIEKGINLDKICPSGSIKCNDCKPSRVKPKKGSKSETKSIWVCLECGNFSCGGVGLPNTPQSHAVRHSKQNRHALAVHYVNHQLIYCFRCDRLVGGRKSEEFVVHKEVLNEVSKRMKSGSVDVEDVWFGGGSVIGTKTDYSVSSSGGGGGDGKGYGIRGLVNLGNTCFFNSVLQNLLALSSLRDYFVKCDASVGPLSASMKKLFLETGGEGIVKGTITPRSLFGNLCAKAPQFKGFQQHDSHELLRYLIDSLASEEVNARKRSKTDLGEEVTSVKDPTFVDVIFGGQLSSTVTCLECGHLSTSYEPILDLLLSVPTKKPQPVKMQPVTRSKKPKLPPRRMAKNRPKVTRDVKSFPVGSVSENSTGVSDKSTGGGNSSGEVEPRIQQAEQVLLPSCDPSRLDTADSDDMAVEMGSAPPDLSAIQNPTWSDEADSNAMAKDMGFTPQDLSAIQSPAPVKTQPDLSDDCSWMDFLDPPTASEEIDKRWEMDESLGYGDEDSLHHDVSLQIALESSIRSDLEHVISEEQQSDLSDGFAQLDFVHPTPISNGIGIGLGPDEVLVNQSTSENVLRNHVSPITLEYVPRNDPESSVAEASLDNAKQLQSESLERGIVAQLQAGVSVNDDEKSQISQSDTVQLNADLVHNSASCDQLRSENSNNDNAIPCQEDTSSKVQISNRDTDCSSAVIIDEQDSSNFGLGDMFNEPESTIVVKHTANDPVVISSDSDPGEVDNANTPVSVESCLYLYTKPEHLSKDEQAWQCDNCSKILRKQMIQAKKKPQTRGLEILQNGCDGRNGVVEACSEKSLPQTSEMHHNGDCMPETELNVITCQPETEVHNEINGSHDICDPEPSVEDANSEELKVKRDATKRLLINRAPSILTICLKRFGPDTRGRMSKLNGHVIFRETIDLKPYMDPRCIDRDSYTYQLVGVVEHSGTMRGGHYVAYVRTGSCVWYHASDVYVRQVSLEEVLASEAYILFYELI